MSEYPTLPEQGKNLAKFAFDVIKNAMQTGALIVSEEIKEERLAICRSCEYYNEKQIRCKQCGCFLQHKASYALDSCPIGKWKESETDWMNGKYDDVLESLNAAPSSEDSQGPDFPSQPNSNDTYTWNEITWTWNGEMWEINQ